MAIDTERALSFNDMSVRVVWEDMIIGVTLVWKKQLHTPTNIVHRCARFGNVSAS